jgi:hypothetical protein
MKKTATDLGTVAKNTFNTPAPIGKTILISGAVIIITFVATHKMKVIIVLG